MNNDGNALSTNKVDKADEQGQRSVWKSKIDYGSKYCSDY